MPFFNSLRRRSKSFKPDQSPAESSSNSNKSNDSNGSSGSNGNNGTVVPTAKSSSTLNSHGSSSPNSLMQPQASTPNIATAKRNGSSGTLPPQRPSPMVSQSKRYSVAVCGHCFARLLRGRSVFEKRIMVPDHLLTAVERRG